MFSKASAVFLTQCLFRTYGVQISSSCVLGIRWSEKDESPLGQLEKGEEL